MDKNTFKDVIEDVKEGIKESWKTLKTNTETILQSDQVRDFTKKSVDVTKNLGKQVGKLWNNLSKQIQEGTAGLRSSVVFLIFQRIPFNACFFEEA